MNPRRPWAWIVLSVVALLPCLAVVMTIHRYGGRLPFEDAWNTPGRLLEAQLAGTLHWKQFFAQHNEARKAFSSCVWMLLALDGWNPRIEMYTSVLLVGTSVVAYLLLCRKTDPGSRLAPMLLATTASVILFNPIGLVGAHPAWLWGVNLENAIVIAVLLAGVSLNVYVTSWPLRHVISAACSIAATYSFANGMLLWLLLYPRWFGRGRAEQSESPRRGVGLDAIYAAAFVTVVVTYFIGFERPQDQPGLLYALEKPRRVLEFYLAWLGAPISPRQSDLTSAMVTGFIGVALFLWSFVTVARHRLWMRALPFLLLSVYTLTSALAVSLGRSPFGASNAMASRYYLHVLVFYLGLNGLLWLCSTVDHDQRRRRLPKVVLWTALALQVAIVASNWVGIPAKVQRFHERNARGEAALQFIDLIPDNPEMTNLHQWMKKFVPRFKELSRAGILDVELVPGREELEVADTTMDQSATLFISTDGERMRIFGALVGGAANERLTHLLVHSRADGREKFISVIPLSIFPRAHGTSERPIDTLIGIGNLPNGPQVLELSGYEFATQLIVPLRVATQQRHGHVSPLEILDATTIELRPQQGVGSIDVVNGVAVQGRSELTVPRGGQLVFTGWAFDPSTSELAVRTFVKVGERLFPTHSGQPRPDLARRLDRSDLLPCGFVCRLDESLLDAETSGPFHLVIETRRGDYLLDPGGLTLQRVGR